MTMTGQVMRSLGYAESAKRVLASSAIFFVTVFMTLSLSSCHEC